MPSGTLSSIEFLDFCFKNSLVKVYANRNHSEIELGGWSVGPFEEGNEYEVYYWIAKELAKFRIVNFRREDYLDASKLYKIQWKERVQVAAKISELPQEFYPRIRRYLAETKDEITRNPERMTQYQKAKQLSCDIVNARLKKIIALSAGPIQTELVLKKFSEEEKMIYKQLSGIINEWRAKILEYFEES